MKDLKHTPAPCIFCKNPMNKSTGFFILNLEKIQIRDKFLRDVFTDLTQKHPD